MSDPTAARLAAARFPTIFAACQAVAGQRRERCTTEQFAAQVARYPVDQLRTVEVRFRSMTPEQRAALVAQLGFRL